MADKEQMFCAGAVNKKPGCKDEDFEEDSSLPPVRTSRVISVDGKVEMQQTCLSLQFHHSSYRFERQIPIIWAGSETTITVQIPFLV